MVRHRRCACASQTAWREAQGNPSVLRFAPSAHDMLELPAEVKAQVENERAEVVAKYKDTSQWLKAPNGEQSNLTEDLWIAVRTPAFIRWFGDWQNGGGTSLGRQINEYGTSGFASLPTSTPTALQATGIEYSTLDGKSQGGVLAMNRTALLSTVQTMPSMSTGTKVFFTSSPDSK